MHTNKSAGLCHTHDKTQTHDCLGVLGSILSQAEDCPGKLHSSKPDSWRNVRKRNVGRYLANGIPNEEQGVDIIVLETVEAKIFLPIIKRVSSQILLPYKFSGLGSLH